MEELLFGPGEVGGHPDEHFVEDDAQEVPVHCLPVALSLQHLRRQISHGANDDLKKNE